MPYRAKGEAVKRDESHAWLTRISERLRELADSNRDCVCGCYCRTEES
mgnify:CR=1 FL=1